ncbi:glycosyl transferase group 1 [Desulfosporosinus sp. HMP52]|uniref:glycosyltransferase n=1 Tax=Desulfosporosinus sp. HMP52 TaxID=1487923 RepID=UPI00051FD268|nr:glycosyltransferase [Desulfosporosinus sp. HMP52]KGK91279.1 glycosyl transferase group 1 [Desulfosporosinus sp. HMP52]
MRVLIVAQNLQIGGVQTALVNMLKELVKQDKLELELFTFGDGIFIQEIPNPVRILKGNLLLRLVATPLSEVIKKGNLFCLFLRLISMVGVRLLGSDKFYRMLFKRQKNLGNYDVAISYFNDVPHNYFNQGTNLFVDKFVRAAKKIAWVHTDPLRAGFEHDVCLEIYKNFDYIACVSKACKTLFDELLPEYQHKTVVVYNFFSAEDILKKASEFIPFEQDSRIKIITVGRVDNATKRMDRIVKVCKLLEEDHINNFVWRIVGDGPDLKTNMDLARKYNVEQRIEFIGYKENPHPYIKNSDLFVLTSAFEGYPMVIGESLILKIPVISTNYAAAEEQVVDGVNGVIVEMSTTRLYEILKKLLVSPKDIRILTDNLRDLDQTNDQAYLQLRDILGDIS